MADVFISYKRAYLPQIELLAARLAKLGISVWFDQSIEAGEDFRKRIKQQLFAARSVIAVWSPECFDGEDGGWVRWEAGEARKRGNLLPVFFASVDLEPPFNLDQTVDLRDWIKRASGRRHHRDEPWAAMLQRLGRLLRRPGLDELDLALQGDGSALREWAGRYRTDPFAQALERNPLNAKGNAAFQIVSHDLQAAMPQHIYKYEYEHIRFIFFTVAEGRRQAPAPVRSVMFSSDGRHCLTGGGDGIAKAAWASDGQVLVEVGDLAGEGLTKLIQTGSDPDPKEVNFLRCVAAYVVDDKLILCAEKGAEAGLAAFVLAWALYDSATGEMIHEGKRQFVTLSKRFNQAIVMSIWGDTQVVALRECGIEPLSKVYNTERSGGFYNLPYFADGLPRMISRNYNLQDEKYKLIDLMTGNVIREFDEIVSGAPPQGPGSGAAISGGPHTNLDGDRRYFLTSSMNGIDREGSHFLWDGAVGVECADLTEGLAGLGRPSGIHQINTGLAIVTCERGLALVDLQARAIFRTVALPADAAVRHWTFADDGGVAALIFEQGNFALLNLLAEQPLIRFPYSSDEVTAVAFSPTHDRIAIGRSNGITMIHGLRWG